MRILFVYPNSFLTTSIPLGLAYMSAVLKEKGHEVRLFDTTFYKTAKSQNTEKEKLGQAPKTDYGFFGDVIKEESDMIPDFLNMSVQFEPDIIAFSIVEESWFLARKLLKAIKSPTPTIAGGVFPTFAPDKVSKYVDHICIGEGEYVLLKPLNGHVIHPDLTNLEALPMPDYDLFHPKMLYRPMQGKIRKTLMIETQRGCPYSCNYCNSKAQKELYKGFYRRKSIQKIDSELKYLTDKYNPEFVYWVGDSFLSVPQIEWNEFKAMYMKYKLPFWMNTRPETITPDRVKDLEEMGCIRCNLGVEHGDPDYREKMIGRKVSNERIVEAVETLKDSSINVVTNYIIGYPGETRKQLQATIDLKNMLKSDSSSAFIFTPYHGTWLRKYAIEKGYLDKEVICSNIWQPSVLKNQIISGEKLKHIQENFNVI